MRRLHPLLALLALMLAPAPARPALVTFDAMTDAFPPNACLPNSGQRVIYVGPFCDGTTCPPDPMALASCAGGATPNQFFLPGVLAVVRRAEISGGPSASARSLSAQSRIEVTTASPAFVATALHYGTANLDLVALGAVAIRISLTGDISPAKPLWCLAQLAENTNPPGPAEARLEIAATAPGDLVLPLAAFVKDSPFAFDGLDALVFTFRDCAVASCFGYSAPGRQYSIGPIRIETAGPTPARATTWGRIKTLYR